MIIPIIVRALGKLALRLDGTAGQRWAAAGSLASASVPAAAPTTKKSAA